MIFIRKALDYIFTKDELRILDTVIPPFRKSELKKLLDVSCDFIRQKRVSDVAIKLIF